jgi:HAD superfamily hydrolase (TIGR01509 family)
VRCRFIFFDPAMRVDKPLCVMIKTVVFDMDGVIIDSEPIHNEVEKAMFAALGIEIPDEVHSGFVGTSSKNMWERLVREHRLAHSVDELVLQGKQRYQHKLKNLSVKPIDGVEELLRGLREEGMKLILASSSERDNIEVVLRLLSLEDCFHAVISGAELPHSKPHPEIFLRAAREAGTDPSCCLVIEDSENGVIAAKAAGMVCIGYRNPNSGYQNLTGADLVIDTFNEIDPAVIKNFGKAG